MLQMSLSIEETLLYNKDERHPEVNYFITSNSPKDNLEHQIFWPGTSDPNGPEFVKKSPNNQKYTDLLNLLIIGLRCPWGPICESGCKY